MPEADFDIGACLARVRLRDEAAARDLVRELYPMVLRLVRRHLPRRTAEEDLCQMIFIKLFQNLDQYSGAAPFEHWVSRVAVNTCLNQLASEKSRPELRWADLSEDEAAVLENLKEHAAPDAVREDMASREVVEKLLGALSPHDRLVVNLLHIEGHSIQEIKTLTGWSTALVKVRAFRARRRLKTIFNQLLAEGKL